MLYKIEPSFLQDFMSKKAKRQNGYNPKLKVRVDCMWEFSVPWCNASRRKCQLHVMNRQTGRRTGTGWWRGSRQNAQLSWKAVRWNLLWSCPEAWLRTSCFSNNSPRQHNLEEEAWSAYPLPSSLAWEHFVHQYFAEIKVKKCKVGSHEDSVLTRCEFCPCNIGDLDDIFVHQGGYVSIAILVKGKLVLVG